MNSYLSKVRTVVADNAPAIATAVGVASFISCAFFAHGAGLKAQQLMEERFDEEDQPTLQEYIETTWKAYIPVLVMGGVGTFALYLAHRENVKQISAVAGMYKISEETMAEYRKRVVDKLGEAKEKDISDEVRDEVVKKHSREVHRAPVLNEGNELCYDTLSGRYFYSTSLDLDAAINRCNKQLINGFGVTMTLNDVYSELGLETVQLGNYVGWDTDDLIEISYDSIYCRVNQRPVLVVVWERGLKSIDKV